MKSPDTRTQDMADLDRRTRQVMSPWFASRTASPPPPGILAGVEERVPTTRRRAAWRIPDWWLWRRGGGQQTGFVLATATSVLVLALLGLTSVGVIMFAVMDAPPSASLMAGASSASPEGATEQAAVAASPVVAVSPDPVPVTEPALPAMPQTVATKATGTVTQAPLEVNSGTSSTSPEGVTEISGIESEAVVAFDDARLSGNQHVLRNEREFGADGEGSVATGIISIENDGGTWSGTFKSATPPGRDGPLRAVELIGDGDYAGLSALLHYDLARSWGDPEMITGVVAPGERPPYPERAKFDYYYGYIDPDVLLNPDAKPKRPTLREPRAGDRDGLPAAVEGSMEQTIGWTSDDTNLFDDMQADDAPELQLIPEWSAADLALDDPRLQLQDYEVLLNAYFFEMEEPGSVFYGRSQVWDDDGGAWRGRIRGFSSPDEPVVLAGLQYVTELTGRGAYEGISALLFSTPDPATESNPLDSWSVEGILFAGGWPSDPEAP